MDVVKLQLGTRRPLPSKLRQVVHRQRVVRQEIDPREQRRGDARRHHPTDHHRRQSEGHSDGHKLARASAPGKPQARTLLSIRHDHNGSSRTRLLLEVQVEQEVNTRCQEEGHQGGGVVGEGVDLVPVLQPVEVHVHQGVAPPPPRLSGRRDGVRHCDDVVGAAPHGTPRHLLVVVDVVHVVRHREAVHLVVAGREATLPLACAVEAREVRVDETLVGAVEGVKGVQLLDHVVVHCLLRLHNENCGVEVDGVEEHGAEVAALEQEISRLHGDNVSVEEDDPLVLRHAPDPQFVQGKRKPLKGLHPRALDVLHPRELQAVLLEGLGVLLLRSLSNEDDTVRLRARSLDALHQHPGTQRVLIVVLSCLVVNRHPRELRRRLKLDAVVGSQQRAHACRQAEQPSHSAHLCISMKYRYCSF
eukprot:Rhum_TRINITY_DN2338_c0_g2::Rhum_TRINITY_DN2338_c0_g2_i1::g.6738::m.6738